jgi:hypothetical protein
VSNLVTVGSTGRNKESKMAALLIVVAGVVVLWVACAAVITLAMDHAGFDRWTWRTLGAMLGPLAAIMAVASWAEHRRPELDVAHRAPTDGPSRRRAVVAVTRGDTDRLAGALAAVDPEDAVTVAMVVPFDTPDPDMAAYRAAVDAEIASTGRDVTVVVAHGRAAAAADAVRRWDHAETFTWTTRQPHAALAVA